MTAPPHRGAITALYTTGIAIQFSCVHVQHGGINQETAGVLNDNNNNRGHNNKLLIMMIMVLLLLFLLCHLFNRPAPSKAQGHNESHIQNCSIPHQKHQSLNQQKAGGILRIFSILSRFCIAVKR